MYDFPELREAHDAFWTALSQQLAAGGIADVPAQLTRGLNHREIWGDPGLLFAQGCQYPLAKSFRDRVRLVATPCYGALGVTEPPIGARSLSAPLP
jgi:hypothetical protein